MRRNIRLSGRKQIAKSWVEVTLPDTDIGKCVSLTIRNSRAFEALPSSAQVKLRLFENNFLETLSFGTLDDVKKGVEPLKLKRHDVFSAPSVQLRIVGTEGNRRGLVLGSTNSWRLRMDGGNKEEDVGEGILPVVSGDISPRVWKLQRGNDDAPWLYIDESIDDSANWAGNDVTFASCALPAVVKEIFDDIFRNRKESEQQWVADWMDWANNLTGAKCDHSATEEEHEEWIDKLLEVFCRQHNFLRMLEFKLEGDNKK